MEMIRFFRKLFKKKTKRCKISVWMKFKPIRDGTFDEELDATLKVLRALCVDQYEKWEKDNV